MSFALITGSAGLIGSEAAPHFAVQGLDVLGIDNDLQHYFLTTRLPPVGNARGRYDIRHGKKVSDHEQD